MSKKFIVVLSITVLLLIVIIVVLTLIGQTNVINNDIVDRVPAPTGIPNNINTPRSTNKIVSSPLSREKADALFAIQAELPFNSEALAIDYSALSNEVYVQKKNENADTEFEKFLTDNNQTELYESNPDLFVTVPNTRSLSGFIDDKEQSLMENHEQEELETTPTPSDPQDAQTQKQLETFKSLFELTMSGNIMEGGNDNINTTSSTQTPTENIPPAGSLPTGPVPLSQTTRVQGIRVYSGIANRLDAMLTAAKSVGVRLGGGGWRSNEAQIAMRQARCPGRVYDSSCRGNPPAAVPGRSRHEWGVAIDFTCDGTLIPRYTKPGQNKCFDWLDANANRYGFYEWGNRRSRAKKDYEAWHWSVDGR